VTHGTAVQPIAGDGFDLVSLSPGAIRVLLAGDGLLERTRNTMRRRLAQMEADPSTQPWLLRLIVLHAGRRAAGHIGFHGPPDEDRRVEVGYTVFEPYRGRGLATAACRALFGWACEAHGITRFRASVAPTNGPSLAVVRKLGFRRTGSQWDDEDGEELVFDLEMG
jgi:RimJ/RimL family protein N-acetyltransferase